MSKPTADESGSALRAGCGVFDWRDFEPSLLPEGENAPLAVELTTYRDHLDELLKHEGEFVVIKGDEILGYYPRRRAAIDAAFDKYGRVSVLVKKVVEKEPLHRLGNAAP